MTSLVRIPNSIAEGITIHIMEQLNFKIQIMVGIHFEILKVVVVSWINRMVKEVELKMDILKGIHIIKGIHMEVRIDIMEEDTSFGIHMEEHNCIFKEDRNLVLIHKDSLGELQHLDLLHIHTVTKEWMIPLLNFALVLMWKDWSIALLPKMLEGYISFSNLNFKLIN